MKILGSISFVLFLLGHMECCSQCKKDGFSHIMDTYFEFKELRILNTLCDTINNEKSSTQKLNNNESKQ